MTDVIQSLNRGVEEAMRPTPEPEPTVTDEQIAMLRKLGFDHVPTEAELREAKARRQAEVREEVLFQADRKHWCEDGTRQVLANLRLQRPGNATDHMVTAKVTFEVKVPMTTWTQRGALAAAVEARVLPMDGTFGRITYSNVVIENLAVDGTGYELTEDLRRELRNDSE